MCTQMWLGLKDFAATQKTMTCSTVTAYLQITDGLDPGAVPVAQQCTCMPAAEHCLVITTEYDFGITKIYSAASTCKCTDVLPAQH